MKGDQEEINRLWNKIERGLDDIKRKAFGKISRSKRQMRKFSDQLIWKQKTRDIKQAISGIKKFDENGKVWEMRSKISDKYSDKQFVSIKNPETGGLTRSRDETMQVILKYNYNLLKKGVEGEKLIGGNGKVIEEIKEREKGGDEEYEEEEGINLGEDEGELDDDREDEGEEEHELRAKIFVLKRALDEQTWEMDKEITFRKYEGVMKKVKGNNKNVYRDFNRAGMFFKIAMYRFYRLIYRLEIMPEKFYITELFMLFKGKGIRNELNANRFIHLKTFGPKIFEKLLMVKLETKLSDLTPAYQVGGQRQGSTVEHLLSTITMMRRIEKKREAGALIFMDIKACFDKIKLEDILVESTKGGVRGRPLRNIRKYTDNLTIKIVGDDSKERQAVIKNSTGQGSGFAPVGTSMVMAKRLEVRIEEKPEEVKRKIIGEVDGVKCLPNFFVDDLEKTCVDETEVEANAGVITEMLNDLELQAHPDKSGVLVFGKGREQLIRKIELRSPRVQNFILSFKEKEVYLGMVYSSKGSSDSVSKTIELRRGKCWVRANEIKKDLADERLQGVGWLNAAGLLHTSVVMSTLSYAAAAFVDLNKQQLDSLESIQRKCLIHILDISQKVTYRSLLFVMGIIPVEWLIIKLKIGFLNNLFNVKQSGQCLETLKADYEVGDVKNLINEVEEYCQRLGIPNVTEHFVEPDLIKDKVNRRAMNELYIDHVKAKKTPISNRRENCKPKFYANLPKPKAKLILCMDIGELNFRTNRKHEAIKRYGSTKCLVRGCLEEDSLAHVRECPGYSARVADGAGPYQVIDYLMELELERNRKFNRSLINFRSF